jgi:hypothetical protein
MRTCLSATAALVGALSVSTLDAHAQVRRPWVDPPADLGIPPPSPPPRASDEPEAGPDRELATSGEPDESRAPAERAQAESGSDLEAGPTPVPGADLERPPTAAPDRRERVRPRVSERQTSEGRRQRFRVQALQGAELRRQNSGDTYR